MLAEKPDVPEHREKVELFDFLHFQNTNTMVCERMSNSDAAPPFRDEKTI